VRNPAIQFQQMEPLFDAIITDDVALGIRFNDEQDEKTLLKFLDGLTQPVLETAAAVAAAAAGAGGVDAAAAAAAPTAAAAVAPAAASDPPAKKPFLYVLNLVRTKHIPGVKRGARSKALAICTQHQFLHIYKPLLLLALDKYFDTPEPSVLEHLFEAVNAMDLTGMPELTMQEKRIIRASESQKDLERR